MGADFYQEQKRINEDLGVRYSNLKRVLCEMVGLKWEGGVRWPGDERGATDEELVAKIREELRVLNAITEEPKKKPRKKK